MSDNKIQVTDGQNVWTVSEREFGELNRNRPSYLPPITAVDDTAKIRSVYKNAEGEIVDELLPPEQVRRRAERGENVVADAASIEGARKARESRDLKAMAETEGLTTLLNAALPGAQFLQNLAVGKDAAAEARQQLSVNMAANLVGNLAEFAIGGKIVGMGAGALLGAERAAALGTALGFSKDANVLAKTGRFMAENAAVDTHFYVQNQLDQNKGLVAEEWARQVGTGMMFASPFLAMGAVRATARVAGQALKNSNVLGIAKNAITMGAIMAPPGSLVSAQRARAAAVVGLGRKLFRKTKTPLNATDEMATRQAQLMDDMDAAALGKPEILDKMSPSRYEKWKEAYAKIADGPVDFLDNIQFGTILNRTRTMSREVEGARKATLSMYKKLQGRGLADIKLSDAQRNRILTEANELLPYMKDVGMADAADAIKRGILSGQAEPAVIHKALFEARVNARFRRGLTGGADAVDDRIKALLSDEKLWKKKLTKKNQELNQALDDVVQVWDDLGKTHIPKHLEAIDVADAVALGNNAGSFQKLRDAMNVLEENNFLSRDQVLGIEQKLIAGDDALRSGTMAYGDAIKINRSRRATEAKLKKEADVFLDVPTSPESFAAAKYEALKETASDLLQLGEKAFFAITSDTATINIVRGVGALHGLSEMEKYQLYDEIHRELVNLTGNPMYMIDKLGQHLDRGARFDPVGTDQAGMNTTNTIFYLQSQLPRQDDTIYGRGVPQPLSAVEEFLEKYAAAYDPISVAYESLLGRVTNAMVDSVRITNPKTYAEMQVSMAEALMRVPADKANPSVVTSISIFMGGMDPMYTGEFIANVQSNYAQTALQDQVISGPRGKVSNRNPMGGQPTTSQRQQSY